MTNQNQEPKGKFKLTEHQGTFFVQDTSPSGLIWATCLNKDRAQQIIDALNEKAEWIRVEDRLPENERLMQRFIVSVRGNVFETVFTKFNWRDLGVSHWRELPNPPTNGKDER